jgi:hypothetical protein
MLFKIFFGRQPAPRRRPVSVDGTPTNLAAGELVFDPARNLFYAGAPNAPVAFNPNIIPAPQIHLSRYNNGLPAISASYIPTANDSWLQKNPEVWLFAYRRRVLQQAAGFVHPTHFSRALANTALYSGASETDLIPTSYTTEFPFQVFDNLTPKPYARVPLVGFDCLQFYWNDLTTARPVITDFPIIKTGLKSSLRCPRVGGLRLRLQFRFAIDNPDATAKEFKLFGPPSPIVYCAPVYKGNYRSPGDPEALNNPRILNFRAFM